MSNSPYGYRLQEAQAILTEVRSIRDAISSGEKEKQELMQVKLPGRKRNVLFSLCICGWIFWPVWPVRTCRRVSSVCVWTRRDESSSR